MTRIVLLLLLLCSCNGTNKKQTHLEVCVLRGPSAIAFAQLMEQPVTLNERTLVVRIVDTPEIMQSLLIRGEADIAVLPLINAANLYTKGINYPLLGCPIWGNLYLTGRLDSLSIASITGQTISLFGAGTTPDLLTRYYLKTRGITPDITFFSYAYPSAREVMQALLIHKTDVAVLAEPFLSIALQKDPTLRILADLNDPDNTYSGFPQTAIVYAPNVKELQAELNEVFAASCAYANTHPQEAIRILEQQGVFAPGMLTPQGIARCKIQYRTASESTDAVYTFLSRIMQINANALGNQLPHSSFITGQP